MYSASYWSSKKGLACGYPFFIIVYHLDVSIMLFLTSIWRDIPALTAGYSSGSRDPAIKIIRNILFFLISLSHQMHYY